MVGLVSRAKIVILERTSLRRTLFSHVRITPGDTLGRINYPGVSKFLLQASEVSASAQSFIFGVNTYCFHEEFLTNQRKEEQTRTDVSAGPKVVVSECKLAYVRTG
jgi:hypothetical protein